MKRKFKVMVNNSTNINKINHMTWKNDIYISMKIHVLALDRHKGEAK
jgi:hypothetical protein